MLSVGYRFHAFLLTCLIVNLRLNFSQAEQAVFQGGPGRAPRGGTLIGNDVKTAVGSLDRTLQSATRALSRVDEETLPEAKKTLEDLRRAITAAERLLANADNTVLGPDAPAQQELREALKEIARSARAIRSLADYLERNPEALIRGKPKESP